MFLNLWIETYSKRHQKIHWEKKAMIENIYRIQAYDSIMCGYFCIGIIAC